MRQAAAILVLAILLAAGAGRTSGAAAQTLAGYEHEAATIIRELRDEMMAHLRTELEKAGPAEATRVCRHLAPRIARRIEDETGWELRRTALRVRNPANAPDDVERGVLLSFETRAMAGQDFTAMRTIRVVERNGQPYVHYMRAIPTFDACLTCHGANLAPDVEAAIAEHYPRDEATGYETGDLRGAFSLYKPYDPEEARRLARTGTEPATAPADLPQEVALSDGRTGDPRAGRDLFDRHCHSCHRAADLAARAFAKDGDTSDMCRLLQTHGLTDEARDCDIIAYIKAIAAEGE